MKRIVWEETALKVFEEAIAYLAAEDEHAALRLEQRVSEAVELLAHHSIGRPTRLQNVRQKIVLRTQYRIYHSITEAELFVIGIRHQRQDQTRDDA